MAPVAKDLNCFLAPEPLAINVNFVFGSYCSLNCCAEVVMNGLCFQVQED